MAVTSPAVRNAPGQQTLDGTIWVFAAEALALPTGFLTLAFLTRQLGTTDYGSYTLVVSVVLMLEWIVTAMFGRATLKCIAETTDWMPIAADVIRLHWLVSMGALGVVWLAADWIAQVLGEPGLAWYLRLFACDLPLFSLAQAHRNVLVGLGRYRHRALLSAGRWPARLLLIVLFVEAGWSITGALVGCMGASLVELIWARCYVRPPWWGSRAVRREGFWQFALPLLGFVICMRLFDKLDLFALKALGGSTALAGVYSAAQNLALVPGIFALSFAPLLLSTLARLLRDHHEVQARAMAQDALRLVVLLLPFAGLTAGAADEIVLLIGGAEFGEAGPILALLIFAALALVIVAVGSAILVAAGRPGWPLWVAAPMLALALAGDLLFIPRYGAMGAATVTLTCAVMGALAMWGAVYRLWQIRLPLASLARSAGLTLALYVLAVAWPVSGWFVVLKFALLCAVPVGGYWLLREFDARELALVRSLLPGVGKAGANA